MSRTTKAKPTTVQNRRARFDYALGEKLTTGIVLTGIEVRQIRDHRVNLRGSFITIREGELWLNNLTLGAETIRNLKLLITKKQLHGFMVAKQNGLALVPVELLTAGRHIKLVMAVAKGKKKYDKREVIKKRDLEREARQK